MKLKRPRRKVGYAEDTGVKSWSLDFPVKTRKRLIVIGFMIAVKHR